MKTVLLSYPGSTRTKETLEHLKSVGVSPAVFWGINGWVSGLKPTSKSRFSTPERDSYVEGNHIGCFLTHHAFYRALDVSGITDDILLLEDDVRMCETWKESLNKALECAPRDWEIINLAPAFTEDKPKEHIAGNVWRIKWPLCTHALLLKPRIVKKLINWKGPICEQIDVWFMSFYESGQIVSYSVLPRIADQAGTNLSV